MSALQVVPTQGAAHVAALSKGTLYEIQDHLGSLLDTVDLCDSPEQLAQCQAEIADYVQALLRKVDSITEVLAHFEHQQEFAASEIERLRTRKEQYAKREERLRGYVIVSMQMQGAKKLEGKTSTLSLRNCPASVAILNEAEIPESFKVSKTLVSIDKAAVKRAIAAGSEVSGAMLVTGKQSLVRS